MKLNYDQMRMLAELGHTDNKLVIKNKKGGVGKGKQIAQVGDLISVPPEIFDGDEPGSYSKTNPDRVFGTVKAISAKGLATVIWVEDASTDECSGTGKGPGGRARKSKRNSLV